MKSMDLETDDQRSRKVGFLLGTGIFLLPLIFAWFTLRQGHSALSRAVSFGWLVFASLVAISGQNPDGTATKRSTLAQSSEADSVVPADNTSDDAKPDESKWRYSSSADEMRGTEARNASIEADEDINLDFPYGRSTPTLSLRDRPEDGLNVILEANGQFLCNSFMDTQLSVKFDDGPIRQYGCTDPSDHSTGVIFIQNERQFVNNLKNAKKVIIEAEFFQQGRRQMKFSVSGLDW